MRPFILRNDPVFYGKVLKALGRRLYLSGHKDLVLHVREVRSVWLAADPSESGGAHFGVEVGKVGEGPGVKATDVALALAWFYGDVVHADTERRAAAAPFSIADRFNAASSHVGRLASVCVDTLEFVHWLHLSELVALRPRVFDEDVVVTESEIRRKGKVYTAPVGTPEPEDISQPLGEAWTLGVPGLEVPDRLRAFPGDT